MDDQENVKKGHAFHFGKNGEVFVSMNIMSDLITTFELTGNQVSVFIFITRNIIEHDTNTIRLEDMAESLSMNISTVRSCISKLVEKKLLIKWVPEKANDRTYHYFFGNRFLKLLEHEYLRPANRG